MKFACGFIFKWDVRDTVWKKLGPAVLLSDVSMAPNSSKDPAKRQQRAGVDTRLLPAAGRLHPPCLTSPSHTLLNRSSTMLSSTFRRAATAAASRSNATINIAQRTMAMGPAQGGEISDELLAKLGSLSTQALVDGLWVMGWPSGKYIILSISNTCIAFFLFLCVSTIISVLTIHVLLICSRCISSN